MTPSTNISSYHSLRVVIEKNPGTELTDHLKKTVLGTPGGLRYKHTNQVKKLNNIGEAYFLLLFKMNRMLGSVGLCLRNTYNGELVEKSWYIRYFSIHAPLRGKKGHSKLKKIKKVSGIGILKNAVMPYFNNPDILQNPGNEMSKSIIFSYIDKENPRSADFSRQMGLESVRTLSTFIFTRFKPGQFAHVKRINEIQKSQVLKEIKKFYSGYTMFHEQYIFFENNYYVAVENGEIVAGLQANPEEWEIVEMKGLGGMFIKIIPYIPFIKKYLNPQKFKFLGIEAIWYKPGKAHYIDNIIESVLSKSKLYIALSWQDSMSELQAELVKEVRPGFLSKFFKAGHGEIQIKFISFTEKEKQEYFNKPAYLSAFDMT